MAVIERISQLKSQGMSDPQIVQTLGEEGVSPKDINESLSQSQIKTEVSGQQTPQGMEGMQPSIMQSTPEGQIQAPTPSTPETPQAMNQMQVATQTLPQNQAPVPEAPQMTPETQAMGTPQQSYDQYPQAETYPQQGYDNQQYQGYQEPYYQQGIDTETIRDISKQVVEENLSKTKTQISEINKLKTELKFQVQNIESRLKKIETTISDLQSSIIKKMGEYGDAISGINDEMQSTQETFSKMIDPIMDERKTKKTAEPTKTSKTKTKKPNSSEKSRGVGFEDYFR
jgi:archaellum component FlaC